MHLNENRKPEKSCPRYLSAFSTIFWSVNLKALCTTFIPAFIRPSMQNNPMKELKEHSSVSKVINHFIACKKMAF